MSEYMTNSQYRKKAGGNRNDVLEKDPFVHISGVPKFS